MENEALPQPKRPELEADERRLKKERLVWLLVTGLLMGVAVWSATHKGGFLWTVGLMIFGLYVGSRFSKNLKSIQTEISRRDVVG